MELGMDPDVELGMELDVEADVRPATAALPVSISVMTGKATQETAEVDLQQKKRREQR